MSDKFVWRPEDGPLVRPNTNDPVRAATAMSDIDALTAEREARCAHPYDCDEIGNICSYGDCPFGTGPESAQALARPGVTDSARDIDALVETREEGSADG